MNADNGKNVTQIGREKIGLTRSFANARTAGANKNQRWAIFEQSNLSSIRSLERATLAHDVVDPQLQC